MRATAIRPRLEASQATWRPWQTAGLWIALPADAGPALGPAIKAIADAPAKKLVITGFHDPTGDPATNTALAKQRAKAVRDVPAGRGVPLHKVLLRKPELTALGGPADEARRVDMRLVDGCWGGAAADQPNGPCRPAFFDVLSHTRYSVRCLAASGGLRAK